MSQKEYQKEYKRKWQLSNKKKISDYGKVHNLRKKFGLTPEEYNAIFLAQNGCCAICKRHQSKFNKAFAVDHDHETGENRGLLCFDCNTGIGKLKDDIDLLASAIQYLQKALSGKR